MYLTSFVYERTPVSYNTRQPAKHVIVHKNNDDQFRSSVTALQCTSDTNPLILTYRYYFDCRSIRTISATY